MAGASDRAAQPCSVSLPSPVARRCPTACLGPYPSLSVETRGDGFSVGTDGGVALGGADPFHGLVGEREVDLARRGTRSLRCKAELTEQGLRDPMVPMVLEKGGATTCREARFSSIPFDQP